MRVSCDEFPRLYPERVLTASSPRAVLSTRRAADRCFPLPDIYALFLFLGAFAELFHFLSVEQC